MSVLACYINILCRALKPRESKRLQAAGQWSIGALGGEMGLFAVPPGVSRKKKSIDGNERSLSITIQQASAVDSITSITSFAASERKTMNREMINRIREYAIREGEKVIGLTMTFLALLTAGATLAGHLAHTDEVISTTLATDQWGFYQAKHIRSHMYGIEAEKAAADNKRDLAERYLKMSVYEQCGDHADPACKKQVPLLKDSRDLKKLVEESPELQKFFQEDDSIAGQPVQLPPCGKDDSQPTSPAGVVNAAEKTGSTPSRKEGAIDISNRAKNETRCGILFKNRAYHYDWAEILLECSIMCCGIALLVGTQSEWKLAYLITLTGVLVAIGGVVFALRGWLLS